MGIAVNLNSELVNLARSYSGVERRSLPKQIEHWAKKRTGKIFRIIYYLFLLFIIYYLFLLFIIYYLFLLFIIYYLLYIKYGKHEDTIHFNKNE